MSDKSGLVLNGILLGKLPGNKEWVPYYLELTSKHLHIYDSTETRRCLRTLEISSSDMAGEESKNKREYRFYMLRPGDGRYVFKCNTPQQRDEWTVSLSKIITKQGLIGIEGIEVPSADTLSPDSVNSPSRMAKKFDVPKVPMSVSSKTRTLPHHQSGSKLLSALDTPLPPVPPDQQFDTCSPRASIISNDSGFGASEGAEFRRSHNHRSGTSSVPSSGGGTFRRPTSSSDSGKFARAQIQVSEDDGQDFDYSKCKWFWRYMSRQDCEKKLREEGKIGNFAIRINANGHYIMSLWRVDGVHHHKILQHGNIFRFERAAVSAEGESLVDLLDNYLKACVKDKKIEPFGGVLYDQYNYAWTPPDFDMNVLQERLKEQKRMREKAALNRTPPSQRKEQYTPIEIDTGTDDVRMIDSTTTDSESSSGEGAFRHQPQCKKQPPPTSIKPRQSPSSSTSESETTPKRKPLPPTPAKKPIELPKPKPTPVQVIIKREDASTAPPIQTRSLIDRMNQPLPPTPAEESPSGGQNRVSNPSTTTSGLQCRDMSTGPSPLATGSALLKEIKAKQEKSSTGEVDKHSKKKQPIPIPMQRPPSKKNDSSKALATLSTKQLHEPAGYANLPVHDAPYQNMGFGPDASAPTQEPDLLYENIQKPKGSRLSPSGAQPNKGHFNVKMNGSKTTSSAGSEYQNINISRRPRP